MDQVIQTGHAIWQAGLSDHSQICFYLENTIPGHAQEGPPQNKKSEERQEESA